MTNHYKRYVWHPGTMQPLFELFWNWHFKFLKNVDVSNYVHYERANFNCEIPYILGLESSKFEFFEVWKTSSIELVLQIDALHYTSHFLIFLLNFFILFSLKKYCIFCCFHIATYKY
jgi:hypothetical protein